MRITYRNTHTYIYRESEIFSYQCYISFFKWSYVIYISEAKATPIIDVQQGK